MLTIQYISCENFYNKFCATILPITGSPPGREKVENFVIGRKVGKTKHLKYVVFEKSLLFVP